MAYLCNQIAAASAAVAPACSIKLRHLTRQLGLLAHPTGHSSCTVTRGPLPWSLVAHPVFSNSSKPRRRARPANRRGGGNALRCHSTRRCVGMHSAPDKRRCGKRSYSATSTSCARGRTSRFKLRNEVRRCSGATATVRRCGGAAGAAVRRYPAI
eukprot:scaffold18144_cov61-Phaeocystis_antarctica.AAC.1